MADYLNLDALATAACVLALIICLGLIVYVVRGWQKRMQYNTRKLKQYPE